MAPGVRAHLWLRDAVVTNGITRRWSRPLVALASAQRQGRWARAINACAQKIFLPRDDKPHVAKSNLSSDTSYAVVAQQGGLEGRSPSKILLTCPSRRQSRCDGQVKEDFEEALPPRAPPRKPCKSNTCSNHRASRCLSDDPLQRSSQMQLQPVKISTSTGAIASGATL